MICKHCGAVVDDQAKFCSNCGGDITQGSTEYIPTRSEMAYRGEETLPEEYRPLSPWAYFGLNLLFSVPIVGFIFLIIFSFNGSNINRRNYARSFWCAYLILGIILVIYLVVVVALLGFAVSPDWGASLR